jgi:hypothetical protein
LEISLYTGYSLIYTAKWKCDKNEKNVHNHARGTEAESYGIGGSR